MRIRVFFSVILFTLLSSASLFSMEKIPEEFWQLLKSLNQPLTSSVIIVNTTDQSLSLFKKGRLVTCYKISTSKYGIGQLENTKKTPLGLHRIIKKIGAGAPSGAIFYAREDSGKKCIPDEKKYCEEDLILTRILWLGGLEEGENKGKNENGACIDSFERYIYIHGTNHEKSLGKPASHGCVRMSSKDMIDLFDRVSQGTLVWVVQLSH